MQRSFSVGVLLSVLTGGSCAWAFDPFLDLWVYNDDGRHGRSNNGAVHAVVSLIRADVLRIRRTGSNIYITTDDMPSYPVGPWPGNPNTPTAQNRVVRIPRTPTPDATPSNTNLGSIGILVNGSAFYNPSDATSFENENIWHGDAMVQFATGMDGNMGHPAATGEYHQHGYAMGLHEQLGDHGHCHSPLFGFAFDGYPVYGAYGYLDANDAGSEVVRMESSFRFRSDILASGHRRSVTNGGPVLPMNLWGPDVSAAYPIGYFMEDYEFIAGLGTLDQHNGRWCQTPDFGYTYAYFATLDEDGECAYPYYVGPQYFGEVLTDNVNRTVVVPGVATDYTPIDAFPCPQICEQPANVTVCRADTAHFQAHVRYDEGVTYRWRVNGVPLSDGPTPWGSVIAGSSTRTLTVSNVRRADEGEYLCAVSGECPIVLSSPAELTVCLADFDCDGFVSGIDYDLYVSAFESGDISADFDGDGFITGIDFDLYVLAFEAGC